MAVKVCNGAKLTCSCGIGPSTLTISSDNKVQINDQPAATIDDNISGKNIALFPQCNSKSNPAVAQIIAASQGANTLGPCLFQPDGKWSPGSKTILINGKAALTNDCKLKCAYKGDIEITDPGQNTVQAS